MTTRAVSTWLQYSKIWFSIPERSKIQLVMCLDTPFYPLAAILFKKVNRFILWTVCPTQIEILHKFLWCQGQLPNKLSIFSNVWFQNSRHTTLFLEHFLKISKITPIRSFFIKRIVFIKSNEEMFTFWIGTVKPRRFDITMVNLSMHSSFAILPKFWYFKNRKFSRFKSDFTEYDDNVLTTVIGSF